MLSLIRYRFSPWLFYLFVVNIYIFLVMCFSVYYFYQKKLQLYVFSLCCDFILKIICIRKKNCSISEHTHYKKIVKKIGL